MGIFSNLLSATVKTVLTPVAVVKDAANIITGEEPDATKDLLDSISDDISDVLDEMTGGD